MRHASTEINRAIYEKYIELGMLPEGIEIESDPLPFKIVKLQRSKLREYLGLSVSNFNILTIEEIRDEDRFILDRNNKRVLPNLEELAFIVDGILMPDSGRALASRALERLSDHARASVERSQCPICQRLTLNTSMKVFDPCGHASCESCMTRLRDSQRAARENQRLVREQAINQQRLDGGRNDYLIRYRPIGNGFSAIDYLDQDEFQCPICRQTAVKAIKCFF